MKSVVSSKLPSTMAKYTPSRYSGPANPVGNPGANSRSKAPLNTDSPPTVMHPKLNTTTWSQSYAVHRKPPNPNVKRRRRRVRNGG